MCLRSSIYGVLKELKCFHFYFSLRFPRMQCRLIVFVVVFATLCRKLCLLQTNNIYLLQTTKIITRRDSESLSLRKHGGSVKHVVFCALNLSLTLNKLWVLKQNHEKPQITFFNHQPAPDISRHVHVDQNRSSTWNCHIFFTLTKWFFCLNTNRI